LKRIDPEQQNGFGESRKFQKQVERSQEYGWRAGLFVKPNPAEMTEIHIRRVFTTAGCFDAEIWAANWRENRPIYKSIGRMRNGQKVQIH